MQKPCHKMQQVPLPACKGGVAPPAGQSRAEGQVLTEGGGFGDEGPESESGEGDFGPRAAS